jgi:hypothetical protein
MKFCPPCETEKPLSEFSVDRAKKDGLRSWCRDCEAARNKARRDALTPEELEAERAKSKAWRLANPEKAFMSVRNATLKKKYGISHAEYEAMLAKQGGGCAICGSSDTGVSWTNYFHVDHCHTTGRVRGILCQPCNVTLGKMRESPDLLRLAADYLEEWSPSKR